MATQPVGPDPGPDASAYDDLAGVPESVRSRVVALAADVLPQVPGLPPAAPDIDALDSGRLAGWARTGFGFRVHPSQAAGGAGVSPVCRIRIPPEIGDSHFYSASPQECMDTLAKFPTMTQESSSVFYVVLPVMSGPNAGACPDDTIPVYRVFDNRADANHRYTTDRALRDQMAARGYIVEGYGNDAVIMCAVPGAVTTN